MTTLENTISILKGLPEPDLIRVQALAEKLFQRHEDKMADETVSEAHVAARFFAGYRRS